MMQQEVLLLTVAIIRLWCINVKRKMNKISIGRAVL